ncbi:sulfur reduction protein DsrE [Arenibacter lacus]|uniref:sulfur reduction protein DsrE n=1 Tax=Arenibacter lacus TaxID=2608629 RepID=UPI00123E332F|nr:sulfur reduction protein DsrE [Arenibacter lacus]
MKVKSLLILAGALLLLPLKSMAQDPKQPANYAALVKNERSLIGAIETAEELLIDNPKSFGEFQIVFCGKSIPQNTDTKIMDPILKRISNQPISVVACGFSLNKFKVDQSGIPRDIDIVENGILYLFQLLKKDYINLDL